MKIEKYTLGIGDRFAHQGRAQLQALIKARDVGIDVHPVWNKSNREHLFIGTDPLALARQVRALETVAFHGCRPWPLEAALWAFLIFYVSCLVMTWFYYTRRGGLLYDVERRRVVPPQVAPAS